MEDSSGEDYGSEEVTHRLETRDNWAVMTDAALVSAGALQTRRAQVKVCIPQFQFKWLNGMESERAF